MCVRWQPPYVRARVHIQFSSVPNYNLCVLSELILILLHCRDRQASRTFHSGSAAPATAHNVLGVNASTCMRSCCSLAWVAHRSANDAATKFASRQQLPIWHSPRTFCHVPNCAAVNTKIQIIFIRCDVRMHDSITFLLSFKLRVCNSRWTFCL